MNTELRYYYYTIHEYMKHVGCAAIVCCLQSKHLYLSCMQNLLSHPGTTKAERLGDAESCVSAKQILCIMNVSKIARYIYKNIPRVHIAQQ